MLIGKNNSGKSNILAAIDAFFSTIRDGNIVTLDPPLGKEIDFFRKETGCPIEIRLTFSLSLAERDALIQNIIAEAPQLKTAVEGIDPSLRLVISVTFTSRQVRIGYVSSISLQAAQRTADTRPQAERVVLSVADAAAKELYQQLSLFLRKRRDAQAARELQSGIDSDDWSRIRELIKREGPERMPFRLAARRFAPFEQLSTEVRGVVERTLVESSSVKDFSDALQALAVRIEEEADAAEREGLKTKITTFAGEESSIPTYVRNLLIRVSKIKVLHLTERRKPIGREDAERLLSLKITRGGDEVLQSVQETVSALLGVKIDAFRSAVPSRAGEVNAEMDVDNFLVEVNGSGIREALRLILDVEFEHPEILLVEEPEIHLHPALETSLMQYLKRVSSQSQVFITTHSTNFLDTAESKNQYLVSKPDSTRAQLLGREEAETEVPRELGIRLSSLFMYDRLVFVEGPSDEDTLREWASKLSVNFGEANLGFIAMGGVRNFTHFAAEATLSFLSRRQVKMWFLVDRDEREDSEVVKLKERVSTNGVVHMLKKREIENYLLCPRAIAEFIGLKKWLSGNRTSDDRPGDAAVAGVIEECVEELKQSTVDRRVAKIPV